MTNTIKLLLLTLLITSCNNNLKKVKEKPLQSYKVVASEIRDIDYVKSYPVSIRGEVSSEVRAKISGYIDAVYVDEGQRVKKGQRLFHIETASLSEQAQTAKAQVEVAEVEVDRLRPLVEKQVISEIQLKTAEARLAEKRSNLNTIYANISYATISSPVNGVVGSINFRQGTLVGPNTESLTEVSDIRNVFAFFSMNEKDFLAFTKDVEGKTMKQKIANLPPVELRLADGSVYKHKGHIVTISGSIDQETGAVSFRAKFPNPEETLRDGSSGRILVRNQVKNALVIPYQSTFEQQGDFIVYRVSASDSLYTKKIKSSIKTKQLLVIEEGLEEGDIILAEGVNVVRSGNKIIPKKTTMDAILNSYQVQFK
ncbi:efflux RND transporter periplasmic adaptor subunit [Flammeovirga kamogawensis]|uniref:Efflux RND transporter periplasmic adaptor subunit n=1 Tax=Flammeovirga kamogawensis TaxID=373891 RepID=A0ABX8H2P7_9BACT|nr:efflux RND transporter periplasmic adaptor subunit [Flammeovirga kamogawensis]MBB6463273.1 membrane fusion protein (multidrug efflux system) [Flammeovirga kamogawensis]QWG09577.1 efflux RND transporter periplasmic adaptor subunit [Flammeovirga kamogawensis]TRX65091.1 efflux RND transporter periplasmic adaptor subunit [Flammeovirga kamogawensis]